VSSEREWIFRIRHILDAIGKISRYTEGMTNLQFANDERTVDAVIRNFLVVGDATRYIAADVRQANSDVHRESVSFAAVARRRNRSH
jgi:uncharacterized protein with HEPN domain